MKHLYLIVLSTVLTISALAQCPTGKIHLSSDEQIIDFLEKYPNCTTLDTLIIGPTKDMGSTRISSIEGFEQLRYLTGSLIVRNNPWLSSLKPLESIKTVGGDVEFVIKSENPDSFSSALQKINGNLTFIDQSKKNIFQFEFPELVKVNGNVIVRAPKFNQIIFPALWKIEGGLDMSSYEDLFFEGELPQLEEVGGDFRVDFRFVTENFSACHQLKKVKSLQIVGSPSRDVDYFYIGSLDSIEAISIYDRSSLKSSSFAKIKHLYHLFIGHYSPEVIENFPMLESVESYHMNSRNELNVRLTSFPKLKRIQNAFIDGDQALQALKNLTSISESLELYQIGSHHCLNPIHLTDTLPRLLISKSDFDTLNLCIEGIINRLYINYNPHLKHITTTGKGCKVLRHLGISSNLELMSISDIEPIVGPSCHVDIKKNDKLNACNLSFLCQKLNQNNLLTLENNGGQCTIEYLSAHCSE